MSAFFDRVKDTTTTTGTGSITLSGTAPTQFVAFASLFAINELFYYAIVGQTGSEWEVGQGRLTASTTLERTVVLQSSNSNALVNFSAGTKDVFNTIAANVARNMTNGRNFALANGMTLT